MPKALPARPSLDWLKKTAKQTLKTLRQQQPSTSLADAQLAVARDHGFTSWRALKSHVDQARRRADAAAGPGTPTPETSAAATADATTPPESQPGARTGSESGPAPGSEPQPEQPANPAPALTRDQVVQSFLRLVGAGNLDAVRRVLSAAPQMVNAVGPHPFWGGRPQALHVAIEAKRTEMVDLLLESGADVKGSNAEYDHWSPLLLAISGKQITMRDALLQRGAVPGLVEALLSADDERVEDLLRAGAAALPNQTPNGGSLLQFARTPFAIDRLIALGVDTEAKDRWGSSPIEAMSRLGVAGQPLVRHLIARGVHAAPEEYARLGDMTTLVSLVERDPSVARADGVMMGAVDFGHVALAEWLLAHGSPVNARATAKSRHTALHSAAWNGDLAMVTCLVTAGADVAALDEEHHGTPLKWAEVAIEVTNNPRCLEVADYLRRVESERG